jgi:hypothetical protein
MDERKKSLIFAALSDMVDIRPENPSAAHIPHIGFEYSSNGIHFREMGVIQPSGIDAASDARGRTP